MKKNEKQKQYMKIYYTKNKERLSKYRREYQQMPNQKKLQKEYYKKNKQRITERNKQYYQKNKERIAEQNKEYYQNNKQQRIVYNKNQYQIKKKEILQNRKQYYQNNKEDFLEKHNKYRHSIQGKFTKIKSHAKRRNIQFNLKSEQFINWYNKQPNYCHYCLKQFTTKKPFYRSIDRKDNSKGYEIDNIVLCCYCCNTIKNNIFTYEEMLEIGESINQIWKKREK